MPLKDCKQKSVSRNFTLAEVGWMDWSGGDPDAGTPEGLYLWGSSGLQDTSGRDTVAMPHAGS